MTESKTNTALEEALKVPGALPETPIFEAKKPYSLTFVNEARKYFNTFHLILGGDHAAYYTAHLPEFMPTQLAAPSGPVKTLQRNIRPELGKMTFTTGDGKTSLSLDEYVGNGKQRLQAVMILHKGKVVYEAFPGLEPQRPHNWASVSKTMVGLVAAILEADGELDVQKSASAYVGGLKGTPWDSVSVFNILNMATGLDISETQEANDDPASMFNRLLAADCGSPNYEGEHETPLAVLRDARRLEGEKPGEYARYSSVATKVLCGIVESAADRPLTALVEEEVWSRIGARNSLTIGLAPDGSALGYGMISSDLEDLARYALIYTPSWNVVSDQRIVSPGMLERIRHSGSEAAYQNGDFTGHSWVTNSFGDPRPIYNSWQWDAVFADGAMFKHGNMFQGIFVDPERDVVGVYFSTSPTYLDPDIMPGYIRQVSKRIAGK